MSRLIVWEQCTLMAPRLARLTNLQLQEVRSLTQTQTALRDAPSSIIAMEMSIDRLVDGTCLSRWAKSQFPVGLVAMLDRRCGDWDAFLLEAGFDVVLHSSLDLPKVEGLCRRFARQRLSPGPPGGLTTRESVWHRLPWKRHASGGRTSGKKGNNEGD